MPVFNRLSVYVQTRTLVAALRKRCGRSNVAVLFGAGNNETRRTFPDVYTRLASAAGIIDAFRYGIISGNVAATKENVRKWFKKRRLVCDTFYLFVLGHGEAGAKSASGSNARITLWGYDKKRRKLQDGERASLSLKELEVLIQHRIKAKRVVFVMTQCHSGGFHRLSVKFSNGQPSLNPSLFGFSATTADLPAQGCHATMDSTYCGYERDFPDHFLDGSKSIYAAHLATCFSDVTEDVPCTTLDDYLECWFHANAKADANHATARHRKSKLRLEKESLLAALLQEWHLANEKRPGPKDWEKELNRLNRSIGILGSQIKKAEMKYWKTRYSSLFRHWVSQIRTNHILSREEKTFERSVFSPAERRAKRYHNAKDRINFEYLIALSHATRDSPNKASALSIYAAERETRMAAWAKSQGLQIELLRLDKMLSRIQAKENRYDTLCRQYALARRVLSLKRQVAALALLETNRDPKAMAIVQKIHAEMQDTLCLRKQKKTRAISQSA